MESRLEEIEAKLSLTEDLLEELNKTVYRQQSQIDQLKASSRRCATRCARRCRATRRRRAKRFRRIIKFLREAMYGNSDR